MNPLIADRFRNDPRLAKARTLIAEALAEHQAALDAPRPPDAERNSDYDRLLGTFSRTRGGELFYRYLSSGFGRGALVELCDGSIKLDLISGIGVHGLGHGDAGLIDACIAAAVSDTVMQGNLQQDAASVALADDLTRLATASGSALRHCFLTTSGATANENALKLILHHHHPADRLIAFENCFMGRTIALASITDRPNYRAGLPLALAVDYIPFFDAADPVGSTERALAVLRSHLARHPGRHAGVCLELVQGEGGYYAGSREFFLAVMSECRAAGLAVLVDEIQTFARLSRPFAFQHFGLDDLVDLATVGKITQACATLFTDRYVPPRGLISQTFTGSSSAIHAARHILERLAGGGFYGPGGRIEQIHNRFAERLGAIAEAHPDRLSGPFGIGAMIACTVFDGSAEVSKRVAHALFESGVIAFLAGSDPMRLRFLPPLGVITDAEIDTACDILDATLAQVARERER